MELDENIHINEYEVIQSHIRDIEDLTKDFATRIETVLKEEELMFTWRVNTFERYELAVFKLKRMSIFWNNAEIFYNEKKDILTNYHERKSDIISPVNLINEIEKKIDELKPKIKKEEEVLARMVKFLEEDYDTFRDFLLILHQILNADSIDEELNNKVYNFLENTKKLDSACKTIIAKEINNKS